ncbi:hypothetical protein Mapa_005662 [Marchantia paleacea]|nr:hypothetical protein Mapa_005662 [Marchantia paleacea]
MVNLVTSTFQPDLIQPLVTSLVDDFPQMVVRHICRSVLSIMWPLPLGILHKAMKSMFYSANVLSQRLLHGPQ